MKMPKFRMIHVDHYMCKPISPFDDLRSELNGRPISKVPVIRIFGADLDGRKICIHVHGFYPYIAIQNREPNTPDHGKKVISGIERALGELVENDRQKQRQQPQPATSSNVAPNVIADLPPDLIEDTDSNLMARIRQERHPLTHLSADQKAPVHRIETIKTINYYGYHKDPEDFFKLYLYNPKMVKPVAQVFEDCRVLARFVPVFWAHIPYILLFFIDNNLRGMQYIEIDHLYWRKDKAPVSSPSQQEGTPIQDSERNQSSGHHDIDQFTSDVEPISSCELEADIRYEWILNNKKFGSKGNDTALRELWLDDQEATQAKDITNSRLPLYELERNYIYQLCEGFDIDYHGLNLELTERYDKEEIKAIEPVVDDSDESLDILLDRDDHDPLSPPGNETLQGPTEVPKLDSEPPKSDCDDEDLFDDDDFILRNIPKIETEVNVKIENEALATKFESNNDSYLEAPIKSEPCSSSSVACVKRNTSQVEVKSSIEPKTGSEKIIEASVMSEDEFSDDDQFLIAVIKAETQNPVLRSQPSTSKVAPSEQLQLRESDESKAPKKGKRCYSDNSMIDGRSIICSPAEPIRSGENSQHSTTSSKETISHEYQFLCIMSMELHTTTRDRLRPDPIFDPIESIFYCIRNDVPDGSSKSPQIIGMIITDPFRERDDEPIASGSNIPKSPGAKSNMSFAQKVRSLLHKTGLSLQDIELHLVDTELELIMTLVEVVKEYDPEILIGYEMEQLSWGYVLERSQALNMSIGSALSRVSDTHLGKNSKLVESNFVQPIMFTGRMVFSTWRIIRHEILLNTCSYERIHHHALSERVPCYGFETLSRWFNENRNRWRVIDYYLVRVVGQMRILDKFDLIAKVSELARVYGTQFIDVITRGSQIGIESMMLRLAKLKNLTPLSPTVMQRNKMRAPEALPLVMEPETNIYYDPVTVLDFQSLYPSVVIAYNYCYSTCLGRVPDLETNERHKFGCSQLFVGQEELKRLLSSNNVHVSPCGVAFVKKEVRHGILPKMLSELITTRAMVKDQMKKNMKSARPNRRLQRILDHRQHGLKMMANTTYGYTGASYTGRMPCIEIADSIVSKGRETLEKAIELVESRREWGAKVIYGDTDSMFIQFENCDRDTAFKRSYEMVEAITAANPHPIKMKFEKIYQPCVLQTKKRYCGFKYESPDQVNPEFEAKGIETVRRDCCPAAARMLEMALRIQFTTRDISQVRNYVQHQFIKIMSGKLSNIQDFIFARQYKPRDLDKTESVFVPAWQITKRLLATDPRAEPRLNERVPFVIIYGEPRTPLVNLAKTPIEVLENLSYRINADYYIQKIICPTLNRVFCTMKVDTLSWFKSMPHQNILHRSHYLIAQKNRSVDGMQLNKQSTMSQYFSPSHCPVCASSIPLNDDICNACRSDLQSSVVRLTEEITRNQRKLFAYHQICRACSSLERCEGEDEHYNPCISYDCQNLFRYHQAKLDALNSNFLFQVLKTLN